MIVIIIIMMNDDEDVLTAPQSRPMVKQLPFDESLACVITDRNICAQNKM